MQRDGASEGIRTLDTHVGNVMLYQAELRSLPKGSQKLREFHSNASPVFRATPQSRLPQHEPLTYFCGRNAKATAASTHTNAAM